MNSSCRTFIIVFVILLIRGTALASDADDLFAIPDDLPETVITAESMKFGSATVTLTGNVRAVREHDTLTSAKAIINREPRWMLATQTPRLHRKENIAEKQMAREIILDALNIMWIQDGGIINASSGVNLKVEERSWDLATHSWLLVNSDELRGVQAMEHLVFTGNVRLRSRDGFGKGNQLDYYKDQSLMILTGDAMIETEEWNDKKGQLEKRIIKGEKITYNTETKEMTSE